MVDLWSHLSSAIWRRAPAAIRPLGRVRRKATSFMGLARHNPIAAFALWICGGQGSGEFEGGTWILRELR
jgi:hypothetical protein